MGTLLDAARSYLAAGLSVIPTRGKTPDYYALERTLGPHTNWVPNDARAAWRAYCGRRPTDAELISWFADADEHMRIAIVGGQVSGGLVRIDFEHQSCISVWWQAVERKGLITKPYPVVATPKGHHIYFRMPEPPGHVLLSSHGAGKDLLVLSETQGEGCYCVAPPSLGYCADSSTIAYAWNPATYDEWAIPTFDQATGRALLEEASFPGLWSLELRDPHELKQLQLNREGLLLSARFAGGYRDIHLSWEEVAQLRAYFNSYGPLLHAVEVAPPPSYEPYEGGDF